MKILPLTQNKVVFVSNCDWSRVRHLAWCAHKVGRRVYAATNLVTLGKKRLVHMHRLLLGFPKCDVDHRDGNGLNNCRRNLRKCSRAKNLAGYQQKRLGRSSIYRGVSWDTQRKLWQAHITVNSKNIGLGRFFGEADAAVARDNATVKLMGRGAYLNFPEPAKVGTI